MGWNMDDWGNGVDPDEADEVVGVGFEPCPSDFL